MLLMTSVGTSPNPQRMYTNEQATGTSGKPMHFYLLKKSVSNTHLGVKKMSGMHFPLTFFLLI